MKTTKKGFTLIELIVVIAIIGVLAAILVPTMLGYVRKSKISSANSTASSVYKAINSALTELDEEGVDVGGLYILKWDGSAWSADDGTKILGTSTDTGVLGGVVGANKPFDQKITHFFADIDKVKKGGFAAIKGGACISVATAADSTYTGTYPSGIVTTDTYSEYSGEWGKAAAEALAKQAGAAPGKDDKGNPTGEWDFKDVADQGYKVLYEAVKTKSTKSTQTGKTGA